MECATPNNPQSPSVGSPVVEGGWNPGMKAGQDGAVPSAPLPPHVLAFRRAKVAARPRGSSRRVRPFGGKLLPAPFAPPPRRPFAPFLARRPKLRQARSRAEAPKRVSFRTFHTHCRTPSRTGPPAQRRPRSIDKFIDGDTFSPSGGERSSGIGHSSLVRHRAPSGHTGSNPFCRPPRDCAACGRFSVGRVRRCPVISRQTGPFGGKGN